MTTTYQAHKQEQRPVITPTEEEKWNEKISENTPIRTTMKTKYEKGKEQEEEKETEQHHDTQRRNTTTTSKTRKIRKLRKQRQKQEQTA
jgi:hypothetical protein